jgi:hypothetical protein
MALSEKDKKKMLTMSMRERTQHRAKVAQQQAADRRKAAAQKAQAARKAEAANKPSTSKSPSFGQQAASSMTGGQSFKTKSERTKEAQAAVKSQPAPASKPKPKPKPQPTQPAASKPKPKPKPEQPAAPAKGKSIAERGGPNFKDYPNSKEGLAAYDKAVANWEKTQKSGKKPVRRPGESNASFNRRMQAYLRKNRK